VAIRFFHVDSFSEAPFAGNPAGVCLLPSPRDATWMQQVASEINLSETAFMSPVADGFSLRWFTPTTEVDLCGHGTLASAHVLWETGTLKRDEQARFHTRSGLLTATEQDGLITLDFPAMSEEPATVPAELIVAMGVEPRYVGRFGGEYLIELETEEQVRRVRPDFPALKAMPGQAVVITSASTSDEFNFVSRCFAPWVGVDEDPVTGSVHCCLGPFWGKRLGKTRLVAYQASARGGVVHMELKEGRVELGGRAVTVLRGELVV
jgi:PhzF family phenazine biosynthesis protein